MKFYDIPPYPLIVPYWSKYRCSKHGAFFQFTNTYVPRYSNKSTIEPIYECSGAARFNDPLKSHGRCGWFQGARQIRPTILDRLFHSHAPDLHSSPSHVHSFAAFCYFFFFSFVLAVSQKSSLNSVASAEENRCTGNR